MNATIKKAFLLIFLIAVCCNATDEWKFDYETGAKYKNFTTGERWATIGLNIIPGVGSYFIMDDFWGAVPQWALGGVGLVAFFWGLSFLPSCDYYDDSSCYDDEKIAYPFMIAGGTLYGSSFIYNIYRSITYDKPQKTAFGENSGFNLAVLPNRNGKLNAFLIYNKAF